MLILVYYMVEEVNEQEERNGRKKERKIVALI